jgi:hypothetical protein
MSDPERFELYLSIGALVHLSDNLEQSIVDIASWIDDHVCDFETGLIWKIVIHSARDAVEFKMLYGEYLTDEI